MDTQAVFIGMYGEISLAEYLTLFFFTPIGKVLFYLHCLNWPNNPTACVGWSSHLEPLGLERVA